MRVRKQGRSDFAFQRNIVAPAFARSERERIKWRNSYSDYMAKARLQINFLLLCPAAGNKG